MLRGRNNGHTQQAHRWLRPYTRGTQKQRTPQQEGNQGRTTTTTDSSITTYWISSGMLLSGQNDDDDDMEAVRDAAKKQFSQNLRSLSGRRTPRSTISASTCWTRNWTTIEELGSRPHPELRPFVICRLRGQEEIGRILRAAQNVVGKIWTHSSERSTWNIVSPALSKTRPR